MEVTIFAGTTEERSFFCFSVIIERGRLILSVARGFDDKAVIPEKVKRSKIYFDKETELVTVLMSNLGVVKMKEHGGF
jgi:hypothetical protein